MEKNNAKFLEKNKIIAVIRSNSLETARQLIEGSIAGGIKLIEITMTIPNAYMLIKEYSQFEGVLIGAGTVLTNEEAKKSIEAGAKFIVSPVTNTELIRFVKKAGNVMISGAVTPTEINDALQMESDYIKLFPSEIISPSYIKTVKGPFHNVKFIPTGGITHENIEKWIESGSVAVGLGSYLTTGEYDLYTNVVTNAKKCIEIVNSMEAQQNIKNKGGVE